MARKAKALRALALLTAMSGASVLMMSIASAPAKASEERLHNETMATYGLLPPGAMGNASAEGGDNVTSGSMSVAANLKAPATRGIGNAPEIEDPALPGYDGPEGSPASSRSAAR